MEELNITVFQRENGREDRLGLFAPDENKEVILIITSRYFTTTVVEWAPEIHPDLHGKEKVVNNATFDLALAVARHGQVAQGLASLPVRPQYTIREILAHQGRARAVEYILRGCPERWEDCIP